MRDLEHTNQQTARKAILKRQQLSSHRTYAYMNYYLHPSVRKLSVFLDQSLSNIGTSGAILHGRETSRHSYDTVLAKITPVVARQEQLRKLMRDLLTMRLRLAVDYSRALPALLAAGSVYSVLPMSRACMEAIALLYRHTASGLSIEERILRLFRDAHRGITKIESQAKARIEGISIHDMNQLKRLMDASSAEIGRVGELIQQKYSRQHRRNSDQMPHSSSAAAQMLEGMMEQFDDQPDAIDGSFIHKNLSDAVHANAMVMTALSSKVNFDSDNWYTDIIDIRHLVTPISTAIGMLQMAFYEAQEHWSVDFPFDEIDQCLLLMVDIDHKYGDDDAFVNLNSNTKAASKAEATAQARLQYASLSLMSPHALG